MGTEGRLLVDGHVHFYPVYDAATFLDAAAGNFAAGARSLGLSGPGTGVLCFTEAAGIYAFHRFRDAAARHESVGRWQLLSTGEPRSLLVAAGAERMLLVAGRQIVTADGLEVLALGAEHTIEDGSSLQGTVAEIRDADAVPVIPWGFGKWWFGRGRRVAEFLASPEGRGVHLGDNGGRLRAAPAPRLFDLAHALGHSVLAGSDPLPFARQQTRAGSYGFLVRGDATGPRPAAGLVATLRALGEQPRTYGHLEGTAAFVASQVGMQLRKHLRRAS
jgi:hypothetical protein